MTDDWTFSALTRRRAQDWDAAARTLNGLVTALEAALAPVLGQSLRWHDGTDWTSPTRFRDLVLARRERHDDGDRVTGAASVGDLRGQVPSGAWPVGVTWELGGTAEWGAVRVRFDAESLGALHRHDRGWLAGLLRDLAAAAGAVRAQISTRPLSRALGRLGASPTSGALTLLPDRAPGAVPPGFLIDDPDDGRAGGRVLVADLDAVAGHPDAVAEQLVVLDRELVTRHADDRPPAVQARARPGPR